MKTLITFTLVLFSIFVFAQTPTQDEVNQIATNFLNQKNSRQSLKLKNTVKQEIIISKRVQYENQTLFHVVELFPKGFIVISNNKSIDPVISYSFNSNFSYTTDSTNVLSNLITTDLSLREQQLTTQTDKWDEELNKLKSTSLGDLMQWPEEGSTLTGGWVETTWDQNAPYNNFCPIDPVPRKRSVVGCIATAWSQIINYHKFIGDIQFSVADAYDATYLGGDILIDSDSLRLDFPSFGQLNNNIGILRNKYQNNIALNESDIATLNFVCGIVSKMKYSSTGSTAFLSKNSFIDKFGYLESSSNSGLILESFLYIIKQNLMNGLPVIFAINKSPEYNAIHAIIGDGYNTDGFFHLNFGWGFNLPDVTSDAWYNIPEGMGAGYNIITDVVYDITPSIQNKPVLTTNESILNLGSPLNVPSPVKRFTINNESDTDLFIEGIKVISPFKIGLSENVLLDAIDSFTIESHTSIDISVQFIPDSIGGFNGEVTILSDSPNNLIVKLNGHGVPPGGTAIEGKVSGVWHKNESPYYIYGHVTIESYEKLEIMSGVDVCFMGPYRIEKMRYAQLKAKGALNDSINFFGYNNETKWLGLKFQDQYNGEVLYLKTDTLSYCCIQGCYVTYEPGGYNNGGAINALADTKIYIEHSRIFNNEAFLGGGIYIGNRSVGIIRNTIIHNNRAKVYGGGITCSHGSQLDLLNVTISNNSTQYTASESSAGAIYIGWSEVNVRNSIIYNNNNPIAGSCLTVYNAKLSVSYCNLDSSGHFIETSGTSIIEFGEGNIYADPLFVDSEKSTSISSYNNKNSNQDITEYSNGFILSPQSPCIDAGNPDIIYNDIEDSQNIGYALSPAMGTLRNDMGAYGGKFSIEYLSEEVTICEGEEYNGLNSSGTYKRTLSSITGSDSVIITNLFVNPVFQPNIEAINDTLKSLDKYRTYQWCDKNGDIINANNRQFVIETSGEYHIVVTDENGCTQTSESMFVVKTNLDNIIGTSFKYKIIPNPNKGKFGFKLESNPLDKVSLRLLNAFGQTIGIRDIESVINRTEQFDVSHLSKGIYYLNISTRDYKRTEKVMVY